MEQTFSLSHPSSSSPARACQAPGTATPPENGAGEEDPESSGRSSLPDSASPDPLAEGVALMAGVVLAVMTVLVPVATVVCDTPQPESSETVRAEW